ncbi:MAG: ribosomal-processing cysteine protease Prp [Eubacteriales bacterium]|nr:ribosomal-processing cysteine protease Prp [Eubacteriales bacterium]
MITVTIRSASHGEICGFCVRGHAGYASKGQDIVCSAVSVLTINAVNSLTELTSARIEQSVSDGEMQVKVVEGTDDPSVQLILKSMVLGLEAVAEEYGDYVSIEQRKSE